MHDIFLLHSMQHSFNLVTCSVLTKTRLWGDAFHHIIIHSFPSLFVNDSFIFPKFSGILISYSQFICDKYFLFYFHFMSLWTSILVRWLSLSINLYIRSLVYFQYVCRIYIRRSKAFSTHSWNQQIFLTWGRCVMLLAFHNKKRPCPHLCSMCRSVNGSFTTQSNIDVSTHN